MAYVLCAEGLGSHDLRPVIALPPFSSSTGGAQPVIILGRNLNTVREKEPEDEPHLDEIMKVSSNLIHVWVAEDGVVECKAMKDKAARVNETLLRREVVTKLEAGDLITLLPTSNHYQYRLQHAAPITSNLTSEFIRADGVEMTEQPAQVQVHSQDADTEPPQLNTSKHHEGEEGATTSSKSMDTMTELAKVTAGGSSSSTTAKAHDTEHVEAAAMDAMEGAGIIGEETVHDLASNDVIAVPTITMDEAMVIDVTAVGDRDLGRAGEDEVMEDDDDDGNYEDSSKDTPADDFDPYELREAIMDIRNGLDVHEFATGREFALGENMLASLRVAGIGDIAIPISLQDIARLKERSTQAPFGKGHETVIDVAVRNAFQIDAADVLKREDDPFFVTRIRRLAADLVSDLGINAKAIGMQVNLYKLLLYEPGCFFLKVC
jgi:hypothetical protein